MASRSHGPWTVWRNSPMCSTQLLSPTTSPSMRTAASPETLVGPPRTRRRSSTFPCSSPAASRTRRSHNELRRRRTSPPSSPGSRVVSAMPGSRVVADDVAVHPLLGAVRGDLVDIEGQLHGGGELGDQAEGDPAASFLARVEL